MKKRVLTLLTSTVLVATIVGCSNSVKPTEPQNKNESTVVSDEKQDVVKKPDYEWSEKSFVKNVPLPDTDLTVVESDMDRLFMVNVNGSEEDFKNYIKKCKEVGFTIDDTEWSDGYIAFDENGERISVQLDGTQYTITVNKTYADSTFEWPTNGLATLIPTPKSTTGEMMVDSTDTFAVYVAKTSKEGFKEFVKGCEEKGFIYDYTKNDSYFQARNQNGDQITIQYGGVETMHVSVDSKEWLNDGWTPPTE